LLLIIICSCLIPLIDYTEIVYIQAPKFEALEQMDLSAGNLNLVEEESINYWLIAINIYYLVVSLFIAKFLIALVRLFFLANKSFSKIKDGIHLVYANVESVFSCFKWIFIPRKIKDVHDSIIEHEKAHIRLKHTYDLILTELFLAFLWFNPLVYSFRKSIKTVHEFQADESVVTNRDVLAEYLKLIRQKLEISSLVGFNSYFNSLTIKKRVEMITKNKSKQTQTIRYLLLIPLMICFTILFANVNTEYKYIEDDNKLESEKEEIQISISSGANLESTDNNYMAVSNMDSEIIKIDEGLKEETGDIKTDKNHQFKDLAVKVVKKNDDGINIGDDKVLIILDGEEVEKEELRTLKPKNIDNISVLKDETAQNLYDLGDKSSVLIINTKEFENATVPSSDEVVVVGYPYNSISKPSSDEPKLMGVVRQITEAKKAEYLASQEQNFVKKAITKKEIKSSLVVKGEKVHTVVDQMPQYPGGVVQLRKDIALNISYPQDALKKNIIGRVIVGFVINKEGEVTNAKVLRGVHASLDAEALRVVNKLKDFKPGMDEGKNVNVSFTVPVTFRLQKATPPPPPPLKKRGTSIYNGEEVHVVVDKMPEYPGGMMKLRSDIANMVDYPKKAKKKGVQGRVIIGFVITKSGNVENVKVLRGVTSSLNKEAVRVVKNIKKFKPGYEKGKPVQVSFTVPVTFKLTEKKNVPPPPPPKVSKKKNKEIAHYNVDVLPEYPGGISAMNNEIAKSIKYPKDAFSQGISGKVVVGFVVDKNGRVEKVKATKGVHPSLDREAERVVRNLKQFTPGVKDGKAIDVGFAVPVLFGIVNKERSTSKKTKLNSNPIFQVVENMPVFPGGSAKLRTEILKNMKLFKSNRDFNDKIVLGFVVNKKGAIVNERVLRGTNTVLAKKALSALKRVKRKYIPGMQRGERVKVAQTIDLNIRTGKFLVEAKPIVKDDDVFTVVEKMPQFPGGMKALQKFLVQNVNYPTKMVNRNVQGRAIVGFVIDQEGKVINSKVLKGVHPELDKEALNVVNKLPNFIPGEQRGKNVKVSYTVPISFKLS
jgi:TonB family protein